MAKGFTCPKCKMVFDPYCPNCGRDSGAQVSVKTAMLKPIELKCTKCPWAGTNQTCPNCGTFCSGKNYKNV